MENDLTISFKRSLYQAVIRFKRENPGALEARVIKRKERMVANENSGPDRSEIREADRNGTNRAKQVPRDLVAV